MLQTKGTSLVAIGGTDEQSIEGIQLVQGAFPFQLGLQQRVPGKTLQRIVNGPITSIYVFYLVHGRNYTIDDYGQIEIIEVPVPPIVLPRLPPKYAEWFDDFSGYSPDGLISRIWGAGLWDTNFGIVDTIITGFIDPYSGLINDLTPPAPPPPVENTTGGLEDGGGNVPPSPPPPPLPGDCSELPNRAYTQVTIASFFTDIKRWSGSATTGLISVSNALDIPAVPPIVSFTSATDTNLTADNRNGGFASDDGFGGFNGKTDNAEYFTSANFDLSSRNDPIGTEYWLVGTKTLSTGVMGVPPNPVEQTTCAAVRFSVEGESYGNIEFRASLGINAFTNPPTSFFNIRSNMGQVTYTSLRIYAP